MPRRLFSRGACQLTSNLPASSKEHPQLPWPGLTPPSPELPKHCLLLLASPKISVEVHILPAANRYANHPGSRIVHCAPVQPFVRVTRCRSALPKGQTDRLHQWMNSSSGSGASEFQDTALHSKLHDHITREKHRTTFPFPEAWVQNSNLTQHQGREWPIPVSRPSVVNHVSSVERVDHDVM